MLERTGRVGIAHHNLFPFGRRPHTVRNDAVCREISAADDIAGTAGGNRAVPLSKKGLLIAVSDQLRAGFAVGIGIIAVQTVIFPVAVLPLSIFIDLIGRHIHKGTDRRTKTDAFQYMHRSHHIGFIGIHRFPVGFPHNGLGCQMKHNLRLHPVKYLF